MIETKTRMNESNLDQGRHIETEVNHISHRIEEATRLVDSRTKDLRNK